MNKQLFLLSVIVFSLIYSCKYTDREQDKDTVEKTEIKLDYISPIPVHQDTLIYYRYDCCFAASLNVRYPAGEPEGTILMFLPYNSFIDSWCILTDFCEKALSQNYVLITPNFGNSIYAYENYDETDIQQKKYPTLKWILEILIIDIQNQFGLLKPNQNNFVAGLSMGGRGAVLTAYHLPRIFVGVASISGYFNIAEYKNDQKFIAALGNYEKNPDRWKNQCVFNDINNYKVPTYIAHGQSDRISQVIQSIRLYESLKKIHPDIKFTGHFPMTEIYGYGYWAKETDNILDFFDKIKLPLKYTNTSDSAFNVFINTVFVQK